MDQRAIANYYVLYRLAQRGYVVSTTTASHADLMACTPDGGRIALLRLRTPAANGRFELAELDRGPSGRNVWYVFARCTAAEADPEVFIVRAALVQAMLAVTADWPRDAGALFGMEEAHDAWHVLGLGRPSLTRSAGAAPTSWSP